MDGEYSDAILFYVWKYLNFRKTISFKKSKVMRYVWASHVRSGTWGTSTFLGHPSPTHPTPHASTTLPADRSAFCPLHPKAPAPICQTRGSFPVLWDRARVGKEERKTETLQDLLKFEPQGSVAPSPHAGLQLWLLLFSDFSSLIGSSSLQQPLVLAEECELLFISLSL